LGQSADTPDVKGQRFIVWFTVFVVFLGLANLLEGLVRREGFWIALGVGFLVLGVSNYVVRSRGR
jgi:hypothetical protein